MIDGCHPRQDREAAEYHSQGLHLDMSRPDELVEQLEIYDGLPLAGLLLCS